MKEVEIHAWCDRCYADAEVKSQAETRVLDIDGAGPLELELCDLHDKELLEPLRLLLAERGVRPAKPAPQQHQVAGPPVAPCPLCGITMSRYGRAGHIFTVHGGLRPGDPRPVQEGQCPDCGATPPKQLAQHRAQAHGVTAADFALEWVRRNGARR